MFKTFIGAAGTALSAAAFASAGFAEASLYQGRTALERDREALMGLRLNLTFGAQEPEMKLQLGAHVELDGQYEFVPAVSFNSRSGLSGLALDGMAADGDATEGSEGGNATLWLIGGGVLVLAAAAAGSGDSDEEFCPTGGLALLDLLECLDED
jgi:hypothetical protein